MAIYSEFFPIKNGDFPYAANGYYKPTNKLT